MKFVFTKIDKDDWNRECSFFLDVSQNDYQILNCNPALDNIESLNKELNVNRDFYQFLKVIRKEFVSHFKPKIKDY